MYKSLKNLQKAGKVSKDPHSLDKSAFLYTGHKRLENEVSNKHPQIKCIDVNLTKYMQEMYTINYETLMTEIKERPNTWTVYYTYELECSVLVRCYFSPN